MHDILALDHLSEGQSAYVTELNHENSLRQRLQDLGLIQGTRVTCLCRSPAGDPVAYLIRGAVIALRNRDASNIKVRPIPASVPATAEASMPWA